VFYLLIIPVFVFVEGKRLLRRPKTFNGLAALVWFVITASSFIFVLNNKMLGFIPIVHVVAIMVYYSLTFRR